MDDERGPERQLRGWELSPSLISGGLLSPFPAPQPAGDLVPLWLWGLVPNLPTSPSPGPKAQRASRKKAEPHSPAGGAGAQANWQLVNGAPQTPGTQARPHPAPGCHSQDSSCPRLWHLGLTVLSRHPIPCACLSVDTGSRLTDTKDLEAQRRTVTSLSAHTTLVSQTGA